MSAINKTSYLLLSLTLIIGLASGCTKKRPDQFGQTQGIGAQKITDVQNAHYTLTTKSALFTPNKSVSEHSVQISDDLADVINNYPLVSYETDSDLLGEDIPLRAKPGHSYQLRYELGDSLLRILMVGKKADIPSEDWPYAVQLEDGLMGVPLVGYNVSYFDVVHAENDDREKTNRLIEKPVKDPKNAKYVRIDRSSRQVFEAIQKVDVYPADYFKDTWYYQATVVQTPATEESAITARGSMDTQFESAEKVRIKLDSRNTMLGVNVNQDKRVADSALDQGYVFSIPIEWKEYEAAKNGRGYGLREESVERRTETNRPYIKIKFEEHFSPSDLLGANLIGVLLQKATGDQKLVDLKMAKDYFSFTLLKASQGLKIRYAFKRYHKSNYTDIRPFDESDFATFGYFASVSKTILTRDFQREKDIYKIYKMNRFNPKVKEIVYHFSKESPPTSDPRSGWVREIGRYAVHFWDEAFQKAGVNIRIRLDESKDVDLGDLRYNILHIIDPLTYQSLGGYGPSVADPDTGEIVSATANILISPYTEGMAGNIRSYIRSSLGPILRKVEDYSTATQLSRTSFVSPLKGFTDLTIDSEGNLSPFSVLTMSNGKIQSVEESLNAVQERLLETYLSVRSHTKINELSQAEKIKFYREMLSDPVYGFRAANLASASVRNVGLYGTGVSSYLQKRIKNECPRVDQFIAQVREADGKYSSSEEVQIVEECTRTLARVAILNTFLHEMGHNFALSHNFKCSADPGPNNENFWTADDIRREYTGLNGRPFPEEFLPGDINPKTSCVMDYMPDDYGVLPVPGKYDIAAIRFVYKGEVETNSGQLKKIYTVENGKKEWHTIKEAVGNKEGVLKPYGFCGDVDANDTSDPLCRRHDYGQTPEEIVDYAIAAYWNSLRSTTYSYDLIRASNMALGALNRSRYTLQMKRIYDEWRFLVSKFLGPKKGYLESMDAKSYQAALEKMKTSPYAKEYALYKPARDKIVQFIFQLAFLPNRYCVGTTASHSLKALELSQAIQQVGFYGSDGAMTCSDPAVQKVLKANNIDLLTEIGYSFNNIYFSNNPKALKEAPDVWGTSSDRLNAIHILGLRMANSPVHRANGGLYPAMLDEPDIRNTALALFQQRLISGVDLSAMLQQVKGFEKITSAHATLQMFKDEEPLLRYMVSSIPNGLVIPGKNMQNAEILGAFSVQATTNPQQLQAVLEQGATYYRDPTGVYYYAMPDSVISSQFIQILNATNSQLTMMSMDIDKAGIEQAYQEIAQLYPKGSEMTFYELMTILNKANEVVQSEKASLSVKVVISNALQPYQKYLTSKVAKKFAEYGGKYFQLEQQLASLDEQTYQQLPADQKQQVDQMKAKRDQMEKDLKGAKVGSVLERAQVFTTVEGFKKEIERQMKEIEKLSELDPSEVRAHMNILGTAIKSW